MKPIVRRGLGLLLIISCAAVWVLSSWMSRKALSVVTCSGKEKLDVRILDSLERRFVAREDVEKWLDTEYRAYAGLRLDTVDLARIESIVLGHSAVKSCEAWLTDDGSLHIQLTQRQPVVRFDDGSNAYYSDEDGFIFPLQRRGDADVPIVDGRLPLTVPRGFKGSPANDAEREWLRSILGMISCMSATKMDGTFRRITVGEGGNLVLTPLEGKESFLFGRPVRVSEKFGLIEKYYGKILPLKGDGYYGTVDIRYKGQLVCRR